MTRKTAIIILATVVVLAGLSVGYLIIFSGQEAGTTGGETSGGTDAEFSFPTSGTSADTTAAEETTSTELENIGQIPKLRQITPTLVSGFTTFERKINPNDTTIPESQRNQTETVYRFVHRASGNVYETTENRLTVSRVTNTTIPKVQEAMFFNSGDGVILRYLDDNNDIETFVGKIEDAPADPNIAEDESIYSALNGSFLPKNVSTLIKSPTKDSFFFIKDNRGYTFDGAAPQAQTLVFEYPITEWLAEWINNTIILTTKPSWLSEGFAFAMNPTNGNLSKLLDDKYGLATKTSPDLTKILYSEYNGDTISTGIYDLSTNEDKPLTVRTLADKCVWGKKNTDIVYCAVPTNLASADYPDDWYLGAVSFNDSIFEINLKEDTATMFTGFPLIFDISNISLNEQEEYLVFQNKKDLSLWSLDIRPNAEITE
ncbi:MAG TPA: hypothetical protein P5328_00290 [Candidatus Paceibacterota bacterium]|nr:hypothetical protein [Candidatus Paceibacterota bacterium]HRZ34234.1 hypothetical protein [Candidatus Paceibacterota bacterium]